MAILSADASKRVGREKYNNSNNLETFFSLLWHSAHREMGGEGKSPRTHAAVEIADRVAVGQFELCFCSRLPAWLSNYIVDQLERKAGFGRRSLTRGLSNIFTTFPEWKLRVISFF